MFIMGVALVVGVGGGVTIVPVEFEPVDTVEVEFELLEPVELDQVFETVGVEGRVDTAPVLDPLEVLVVPVEVLPVLMVLGVGVLLLLVPPVVLVGGGVLELVFEFDEVAGAELELDQPQDGADGALEKVWVLSLDGVVVVLLVGDGVVVVFGTVVFGVIFLEFLSCVIFLDKIVLFFVCAALLNATFVSDSFAIVGRIRPVTRPLFSETPVLSILIASVSLSTFPCFRELIISFLASRASSLWLMVCLSSLVISPFFSSTVGPANKASTQRYVCISRSEKSPADKM